MSSLLQHDGETGLTSRGSVGVTIKLYTTSDGTACGEETDTFLCGTCGRRHARLAKINRRPVGMFGCWVEFRINGRVHVPDMSLPYHVVKLPRDARRMTDAESAAYWHS